MKESTYNAVILDYYGWSPQEYRAAMKTKLLRQKVAFAVDEKAETLSKNIETAITGGNSDLQAIANAINVDGKTNVVFWPPALVPLNNQDGGLTDTAIDLEVGQTSKAIKTTAGDGYYYVKVLEKTDTQIRYEYIQIPLTAFSSMLDEVENSDKSTKFITIPKVETQTEPTTNQ